MRMFAAPSHVELNELPAVEVFRVVETTPGELQCIVRCCYCKHIHVHNLVKEDLWSSSAGPRAAHCSNAPGHLPSNVHYWLSMQAWRESGSVVCK